ncbi:MAG: hypothetical protein Ct9H300mP1_39470 [Planctomycetaceae bacterium]|nr:MAG: hypothetical protein Ct9H300mP1_39470 [Planctomycetaceae bacterium]
MTYARNIYRQTHKGPRVRGAWLEADQKIRRHVGEAKIYQNADGTFSASYFLGPPQKGHEFQERIETSGHTLEWLIQAATDDQFQIAMAPSRHRGGGRRPDPALGQDRPMRPALPRIARIGALPGTHATGHPRDGGFAQSAPSG